MKMLFIAPKYEGGIGGHALRVAEKLRGVGHDVKIMHTPHLPIKKLKNPSFAALSSLKAILDTEKYDIVHAFNLPSAFAMKQVNAKKKILSIHGVYSEQVNALHSDTTAKVASIAESKVLKWADVLTTDSQIVKEVYGQKLGVNFEFMYAPLDIEKFKNVKDVKKKDNQVVYIGRDSFEKGIDILKKIESKINGNVVYCTDLEWKDAMKKLKESQILIIPSRMESIPQVIKEAFFFKIPVIAFDVGGISELVKNDINGKLVSPENENELLKQINVLLEDKQQIQKLGINGYNFVIQNLTWESLLPKYENFYKNLLES
ncbi:MAG: glycosyltransferase [Candidatus Nitrosopelagicus sp.]|nr:MAG: glycosyltransferase [Candidatus Nitrosopelagicus sp.]